MSLPSPSPTVRVLVSIALFSAGGLLSCEVLAKGPDLHKLWDSRCGECHGHAGEFASKYLTVKDGKLQGRHHERNLLEYLGNHYPPQGQVQALHDMLLAQAKTRKRRFKEECSACHGSAAEFARQSLEIRNEIVFARKSDKEIREFLGQHRGLAEDDVAFFTGVLTRVAREVYRE